MLACPCFKNSFLAPAYMKQPPKTTRMVKGATSLPLPMPPSLPPAPRSLN